MFKTLAFMMQNYAFLLLKLVPCPLPNTCWGKLKHAGIRACWFYVLAALKLTTCGSPLNPAPTGGLR
jgi:hypothetical protein